VYKDHYNDASQTGVGGPVPSLL